MQATSQSIPNSMAEVQDAPPRSVEDLMYQVGTLGAILLVLTSILLF